MEDPKPGHGWPWSKFSEIALADHGEVLADNMKTAVDKVGVGKRRIVNTRFAAMAAHYLFEPDFCNVAARWEKGVVEKNVQNSRRRIWQDAGNQHFGSFNELNGWLEARCQALWSTLSYPDVEHLTIADALTIERDTLMPMVPVFDGYVEAIATISSTSLVSIERNKYSAPCAFAHHKLSVRLYPERIEAHDDDGLVAVHARSFERGEVVYTSYTPSDAACVSLCRPAADNSTTRHRSTNCCVAFLVRVKPSKISLCRAVNVIATDLLPIRPPTVKIESL